MLCSLDKDRGSGISSKKLKQKKSSRLTAGTEKVEKSCADPDLKHSGTAFTFGQGMKMKLKNGATPRHRALSSEAKAGLQLTEDSAESRFYCTNDSYVAARAFSAQLLRDDGELPTKNACSSLVWTENMLYCDDLQLLKTR